MAGSQFNPNDFDLEEFGKFFTKKNKTQSPANPYRAILAPPKPTRVRYTKLSKSDFVDDKKQTGIILNSAPPTPDEQEKLADYIGMKKSDFEDDKKPTAITLNAAPTTPDEQKKLADYIGMKKSDFEEDKKDDKSFEGEKASYRMKAEDMLPPDPKDPKKEELDKKIEALRAATKAMTQLIKEQEKQNIAAATARYEAEATIALATLKKLKGAELKEDLHAVELNKNEKIAAARTHYDIAANAEINELLTQLEIDISNLRKSSLALYPLKMFNPIPLYQPRIVYENPLPRPPNTLFMPNNTFKL